MMGKNTVKIAEETRWQKNEAVNLQAYPASSEVVRYVPSDQLRPHPRAAAIYGTFHGTEDSLKESIKTQGILMPLLVTTDGLVVAGNERLRVARHLGIDEVPVRVLPVADEMEIEEKLIESNVARDKTREQKIREYQALKRIEAARAAVRKGVRADLMENFPSGDSGAARDLAAAKIGWSGRTADDGAKVLGAMEAHAISGANMQAVEEVRTILNGESVSAAYQKAIELGWIPAKTRATTKARSKAAPRVQAVYKTATAAAEKLVSIVKGEEIARFTPEHIRGLRKTLEPLLQWIDAFEPTAR